MPGYHTEHDTVGRVRPESLVAMARLVIATVVELASRHANAEYTRHREPDGAGTLDAAPPTVTKR
jgi:hypothetical protein